METAKALPVLVDSPTSSWPCMSRPSSAHTTKRAPGTNPSKTKNEIRPHFRPSQNDPRRKTLWRDDSGAALLEFTITVTVFMLVVFGIVEFGNLFYQWNAATNANNFGARLAAVSEPVASNLNSLTGLSNSVLPGYPMPTFDFSCTSNSSTAATGACTGAGGTYSVNAMRTLVFGRDVNGVPYTACQAAPANAGMCNLFDRITPQNVVVQYQYTGLGYAGRPPGPGHTGAPVPTITVSLTGITFQYFFLNGLVPGFNSVTIPGLATTITGEDLNSSGS